VSGFTAPEKWPAALAQGWKQTVGTGDATPALVGDKLYVFARQGDDEVTLCMDAATGEELWKDKYAAQAVEGAAKRHPGPRSSPAVAEGKVVTLGAGGVVTCLDAASGKRLWQKDEFPKVVPQFFTSTSPIIVDGLCITLLGGKGNGAVMAFDLATGNSKWKWTGDSPAYASPVVMTVDGTKMVVAQAEKNLVGLAALDGKPLWQIPTPIQGRVYNSATPIVDGSTVFYTGQGTGTRAVKIEKQEGGFAVKELWTNEKFGTGYNTPVLKDGFLFGCSEKGELFCLNAKTGQAAWNGGPKLNSFCSIVDAGSVMAATCDKASELFVFKPTDKAYEELAKIKVADSAMYAHPVIAGKKIFVKDSETLTLWKLE
jgi:outer membrane protein assembly factor BamB